MRRAVELAARGPLGDANPRVGCVILDPDGTVIGEGWHRGAGTPHAEAAALADAAVAGHDVAGATAVVTLEPCAHHGRTPPCADALVAAGVGRVVFAVADPTPQAAGGADRLRAAGITVVPGVLADAGAELLGPWLADRERRRPRVIAKIACTMDGRIAAADGTSRWITSAESRAHAHTVRATVDAVVVGTGTALTDDPSLTARTPAGQLAEHQPLRVVVGHRPVPQRARLRGPGGELVHLPTHDPHTVIAALSARGVDTALVEGGPTLLAALLRAGVVDEVHAYVAPVLLGAGPAAVGDLGITTIADAVRLRRREVRVLGQDFLVMADVAGPHTEGEL